MDKKRGKEPGIKEWAIILAAGAVLLILSVPGIFQKKEKKTTAAEAVMSQGKELTEEYEQRMERKLEEILLQVDGVTDAKVMITFQSTMEKVVLQDTVTDGESTQEEDGTGGKRAIQATKEEKKAVLAGNSPYLTKELTPAVEGVLAVITGAKKESILTITEAVQALFAVPAHKVKIIIN